MQLPHFRQILNVLSRTAQNIGGFSNVDHSMDNIVTKIRDRQRHLFPNTVQHGIGYAHVDIPLNTINPLAALSKYRNNPACSVKSERPLLTENGPSSCIS